MLEQPVGSAIEPHHTHRLEIVVNELAQGAVVPEPSVGEQLTPRRYHAPNQRAHRGATLRTGKAEPLELLVQCDLAQRLYRDMLDPDAARAQQVDAVDINRVVLRRH